MVDLDFDLDSQFLIKVSSIIYDCDFSGNQKYFINKQKKRGEVHLVPIYSIVFQEIFYKIKDEPEE